MKKFRLAALLLLLAACWPWAGRAADPAPAPSFEDAVKGLNADEFDDKIAAILALGAMGDARAEPVLQALAGERLFALSDGRLVYGQGQGYLDAIDGKPVEGLTEDDMTEVTLNNRVRGVLEGVLGRLSLFSADPAARRKAAREISDRHDPADRPLLARAFEKETDPATRKLLENTLAGLELGDMDAAVRLAAIARLSGSNDPNVAGLLDRLLDREKDQAVRQAATRALSSIRFRLGVIGLFANLFQGISLGSILLLASIGLAITFGVMGIVNMAHGEMIMLGAYATFAVQQAFKAWAPPGWLDFYLVAAVPVAFLVTAAVGMALERSVIRFLYGRPLETLLSTWGISLILQQAVRSLFGPDNQAVANPSWMSGGLDLAGGFTMTWNRLVIVIFCLAVLGGLAALFRFSIFGLQMRAVAQNRPMAAAMGIRTGSIDAATFALGSGIAGMAGVALSQIGNVSPNLGQIYIVDSFMVVVFGGVGSLWGTLLGALSLGVVNKVLEPFAGAILGKIAVLVFIIVFIQRRPRGLFALKGRSVEN